MWFPNPMGIDRVMLGCSALSAWFAAALADDDPGTMRAAGVVSDLPAATGLDRLPTKACVAQDTGRSS